MKLQGEFTQRLRRLERKLLQALNESQGNILDDEKVIQTLETLKAEAAEITAKAAETEGVMTDVTHIMTTYERIAQSCSAIFAVLEQLYHVDHFYQFSLQYFVDIFDAVLQTAKASSERDSKRRVDSIVHELFSKTYHETSASLWQKDHLTLAMLLAHAAPFPMDKSLIDVLLDQGIAGSDVSATPELKQQAMTQVSRIGALKDVVSDIAETDWNSFLEAGQAEDRVPAVKNTSNEHDRALKQLLLVKLFRVDRLIPATRRFVKTIFGVSFLDVAQDLGRIATGVAASSPIALCSSTGFDASFKVDQLVERVQATCTSVAMC